MFSQTFHIPKTHISHMSKFNFSLTTVFPFLFAPSFLLACFFRWDIIPFPKKSKTQVGPSAQSAPQNDSHISPAPALVQLIMRWDCGFCHTPSLEGCVRQTARNLRQKDKYFQCCSSPPRNLGNPRKVSSLSAIEYVFRAISHLEAENNDRGHASPPIFGWHSAIGHLFGVVHFLKTLMRKKCVLRIDKRSNLSLA